MGSTTSIEALFDWLVGAEGPGALDILVANAAATSFKPLLAVKPHNVEKTFAISVTGFLTAVQRAVPLMQARGRGRIVAISGGDTRQYGPVHGLLAAAKAAMETLVRYLQIELHGTGVTAIGINPYAFRSDSMVMQFGAVYERLIRTLDAVHPRGAIPEADDVAEVVALCCTDAATWLAGDTLVVDGGGAFALGGKFVQFALGLPSEALDAAISKDETS
jgi:enoyl-[acyl-carrier protein] reductase III